MVLPLTDHVDVLATHAECGVRYAGVLVRVCVEEEQACRHQQTPSRRVFHDTTMLRLARQP
jgi:hypothetical protein